MTRFTRVLSGVIVAICLAISTEATRSAGRPALAAVLGQAPSDPLPASCTPFGPIASTRPVDAICGSTATQKADLSKVTVNWANTTVTASTLTDEEIETMQRLLVKMGAPEVAAYLTAAPEDILDMAPV